MQIRRLGLLIICTIGLFGIGIRWTSIEMTYTVNSDRDTNKQFKQFIDSFETKKLPAIIEHPFPNNKMGIPFGKVKKFISSNRSYLTHFDSISKYKSECGFIYGNKFSIKKEFVVVSFYRTFQNGDDVSFDQNVTEYILATFSMSGKLIDKLYIAGVVGQYNYKDAVIDTNWNIETKEYAANGGKSSSINGNFDVIDKK
ncbi:MAG TPA: hypothetical protein VN922_15690, partial [Bacteroidia bacterium]|nr:hypothetical protein [Bacteroidia bacterium]